MNRSSANKVLASMRKELRRSIKDLKAPSYPRPYYISYLFKETETFNVWARYGSIVAHKKDRQRHCYADVRVGSYAFDHVSQGGLHDNKEEDESAELCEMPLEDGEDGLRFALWRLTDSRYREAVSSYFSKKSRQVSYLDENKGIRSWQKMPVSKEYKTLRKADFSEESMTKLVKKLSLVLKDFPDIKSSYCDFSAELVSKVYVNSEGSEKWWQIPHYNLTIYAWYHSPKVNQDFTLTFQSQDLREIPSFLSLKKQILKKIDFLYSLENADKMRSYSGPVLLAPQPAGLLIHEVLGHRLEGVRLLSDREGKTFQGRIGDRITHTDLSIYDDPTMKTFGENTLSGYYPFDDEGSPAERADLIEKGVLKGFLTTRSPITKKIGATNGHARTASFERPVSRMANLIVESHSKHSWDDLKSLLVAELKKRHLPYGIILLEVEGGETETDSYDFQAFMGQVTEAVKIYANGKEKLVRGVDFVGTPLNSLANIIAVGSSYEVDNSYCGAESGTIPVSTVAPALLLSDLELQLKSPNAVTQYVLPLPWMKTKSRKPSRKK